MIAEAVVGIVCSIWSSNIRTMEPISWEIAKMSGEPEQDSEVLFAPLQAEVDEMEIRKEIRELEPTLGRIGVDATIHAQDEPSAAAA